MKQEEANQITTLLLDRIRNEKPKLQHGIIVWKGFFLILNKDNYCDLHQWRCF